MNSSCRIPWKCSLKSHFLVTLPDYGDYWEELSVSLKSSKSERLSSSSDRLSRRWQYVRTNFITRLFPSRFRSLEWIIPNDEKTRSNPSENIELWARVKSSCLLFSKWAEGSREWELGSWCTAVLYTNTHSPLPTAPKPDANPKPDHYPTCGMGSGCTPLPISHCPQTRP